MEIALSQSALGILLNSVGKNIPLNTPITAEIVEVKQGGMVVVEINGQKMELSLKELQGLKIAVGEELTLLLLRDAKGEVKAQWLPDIQSVSPKEDSFSASSPARLLNDFIKAEPMLHEELKIPVQRFISAFQKLLSEVNEVLAKVSQGYEPQSGKQPNEVAVRLMKSDLQSGLSIQPKLSQGVDSASPFATIALTRMRELSQQAQIILSSRDAPPQLKEKVKELVSLGKSLFSPVLTASGNQAMLLSPDEIKASPVRSLPDATPVTLIVEKLMPDGSALLRTAQGETLTVPLPMEAKENDRLTAFKWPEKGLFVSPKPQTTDTPGILLSKVNDLAREIAIEPQAQPQGTAPLSDTQIRTIADRVNVLTEKYDLQEPEQTSLIKSLLLLHSRGMQESGIRPEMAIFRNLQELGQGLDSILRELVTLNREPDAKEWVKSLMQIVQPLMEKPLLEQDSSVRTQVLKRIFENNGQFFENKLFRLLEQAENGPSPSPEKLKNAIKSFLHGDLKSVLQELCVFLENSKEIPLPVKDRLQQETTRLTQMVEAVQVKSLAQEDYHHCIIPFVDGGEEKSAYISIKRKGRRKKVDGKNTALTVRVAPSVLGEVEGRVEIKQGTFWVNFLVERESLVALFKENQGDFWGGILKSGYIKGGFNASLFPQADKRRFSTKGSSSVQSGTSGLDLKA